MLRFIDIDFSHNDMFSGRTLRWYNIVPLLGCYRIITEMVESVCRNRCVYNPAGGADHVGIGRV